MVGLGLARETAIVEEVMQAKSLARPCERDFGCEVTPNNYPATVELVSLPSPLSAVE